MALVNIVPWKEKGRNNGEKVFLALVNNKFLCWKEMVDKNEGIIISYWLNQKSQGVVLALVTTAVWKVKGAQQWREKQKLSLALVNKMVMHHDKKGVLIAWEGQLSFGNQSISH